MPKYFVEPDCIIDNYVYIKCDEAKHILNVMRTKVGESIVVCDGLKNDYYCKVCDIQKENVRAEILEKHLNNSEPNVNITLFQCLPKSDKMEFVIQKCVEIGVNNIVPVLSERCVAKIDSKNENKKIERWQKISLSAAKQCGRGIVPKIENVISFNNAVNMAAKFENAIIPYENEIKTNIKSFINNAKIGSVGIFIGPEGGFSENEIKYALDNGVISVTLGKRILRTETAGMVTAAIILYELD